MTAHGKAWYQKRRITVMDIVLIALLAVLQFVVSIFIQASVAIHPGFPPVLAAFAVGFIFVLVGLLVRKVGTQLLFGVPHGVFLALSPAITIVPHPIKLLSGLLVGLIAEVVLIAFRKTEKGAALVLGLVIGPVLFWLMVLTVEFVTRLTPIDDKIQSKLLEILPGIYQGAVVATPACAIAGLAAGLLAYRFYKRIENTAVVKRLQSWQ